MINLQSTLVNDKPISSSRFGMSSNEVRIIFDILVSGVTKIRKFSETKIEWLQALGHSIAACKSKETHKKSFPGEGGPEAVSIFCWLHSLVDI